MRYEPSFFKLLLRFFFILHLIMRISRIKLEITYGGITLTPLMWGEPEMR